MADVYSAPTVGPNATSTKLGLIQLTGDLGGSAASPTINLGAHTAAELPFPRTVVADVNYTSLSTDLVIAYTSLTAARVVNLIASASVTGKRLIIKDESGSCSGSFTLTLTPNGAEKIDGASTKVVNSAYGLLRIYSNGTNWFTW